MAVRKFVVFLLSALIVLAFTTGCSKNSGGDKGATVSSETSTGSAGFGVSSKKLTITLWDIATEDPTKGIQERAVERFMTAYPNITVDNTHIQNDTYKQKLIISMSSGQCPDMYIHWGGGPMNEYIDSGFAVPITDLMKEHCDIPFLDAAIAQSMYKGDIYAVPFGGIGGSGIFYNKTIFNKLGLGVPGTIAELEATCETLKKAGYIPFSLANQNKWTGSMYFMYLATRYGGVDEFNAAVDGTGSFESPAFQYAGEKIQQWVRAGYFPDGVNSLNTDDGQDRQLIYTEEAAMMLHGSWQAASMRNDNEEWYVKNMDYFRFPNLASSDKPQNIVVGTSIGNGFSFNIHNDQDKLNSAFILATQYFNDDTYNSEQLATGRIPSIKGMGDTIEDHCMQKIWADFSSASNVQLWYDQYLPPAVGEAHKNTCQEIFGLTKTPAQANAELNKAMRDN